MDVGEYIRNKQKKEKNEGISSKEAIDRYSAMSEEQLLQELFRVGRVSSGNVSAQELDSFFNSVKGFLTPEQTAKMRMLIAQLKQG